MSIMDHHRVQMKYVYLVAGYTLALVLALFVVVYLAVGGVMTEEILNDPANNEVPASFAPEVDAAPHCTKCDQPMLPGQATEPDLDSRNVAHVACPGPEGVL